VEATVARLIGADPVAKSGVDSATILNNLAWEGLKSGTYDGRKLLAAARRAHELAPANPAVLNTYAAVLAREGKHQEVIDLLDQNAAASGEPELLCRLAAAFEKRKNVNRAVRTYQQALGIWETKTTIKPTQSKAEVEATVKRLNE
jgi:tetratricopeptide (TPR) repeat protein